MLQRHFSQWSTVSYAISILGVLGSVPATFGVPMASGGPATCVWAWFIGSVMAYCIASSGMLRDKSSICHVNVYAFLIDMQTNSRRTGICVPNRGWHVLCNETRRTSESCRRMGVDHWLVQFSWPSCRRCKFGLYHFPDDSSYRRYTHL